MGVPDDMMFAGLFPDIASSHCPTLAAEKAAMIRAQLGETIPAAGVLHLLDPAEQRGMPGSNS